MTLSESKIQFDDFSFIDNLIELRIAVMCKLIFPNCSPAIMDQVHKYATAATVTNDFNPILWTWLCILFLQ